MKLDWMNLCWATCGPAWECSWNLSNAKGNKFWGRLKREIRKERLSILYCGSLSVLFRNGISIVISLVFASVHRFGNIWQYSNQNGLAYLTGLSEKKDVNFEWSFSIQSSIQDLFFDISVSFQYLIEYQEVKNSLNLDVHKKKNGSKNRVLNDFLIKGGRVSTIVCSCKSSYRESLYFLEVDAFLVSNKSGER